MSRSLYVQLLDLAAGGALVAAVLVLWRRGLGAIVRTLAVQGAAVAAVALILGLHDRDAEQVAVAGVVFALKAIVIPLVLLRVIGRDPAARETDPLVNIPSSLLAAAGLTLVAYATTTRVVSLAPSPETRALPIGVAVALIGFFTMVARRKAIAQVVGFLMVENGIALVAFLATSGVPLIVELGASLDVLLAALVLQVLMARMRLKFGGMDLDQLQELHD